jgi:hypothetical protein
MNSQQSPNDEALQRTLRKWVVDNPLPPHFQEQVWHRIGRAESQAQPPTWSLLWRFLETGLTRRQVAFAYIAVFLALGMGVGAWAAQRENNRLAATLGSEYVQSVDPYHAPR